MTVPFRDGSCCPINCQPLLPLASLRQVRKAVTDFIPASFAAVGAMVKAYQKAERRCARGKERSPLQGLSVHQTVARMKCVVPWRLHRASSGGVCA